MYHTRYAHSFYFAFLILLSPPSLSLPHICPQTDDKKTPINLYYEQFCGLVSILYPRVCYSNLRMNVLCKRIKWHYVKSFFPTSIRLRSINKIYIMQLLKIFINFQMIWNKWFLQSSNHPFLLLQRARGPRKVFSLQKLVGNAEHLPIVHIHIPYLEKLYGSSLWNSSGMLRCRWIFLRES